MQAPKNGFFYVLDRATGEYISQPYVALNWATGLDARAGRSTTRKHVTARPGRWRW